MWKEYQNTSLDRNLKDIRADRDLYHPMTPEIDEKDVLKDIEEIQRDKYFDLVREYKQLNGEKCWRSIVIPKTVDPAKLNQLGVYWATDEDAAEPHWAKSSGIECVYEAVINFDMMDWPGTMFARMDYTLGDDEREIRFLKNSKLFVNHVIVSTGHPHSTYMNKIPIMAERRL